MLTRIAGSSLGFLVCVFALMADDAPTETKRLQGQWSLIAFEMGGDKAPAEILKLAVTISGDKVTFDKDKREFSFVLDPSKNPKSIDVTSLIDPNKGEQVGGIYKLAGNELTICIPDEKDAERPNEFAAPAGTKFILITLKKK